MEVVGGPKVERKHDGNTRKLSDKCHYVDSINQCTIINTIVSHYYYCAVYLNYLTLFNLVIHLLVVLETHVRVPI